MFIRKQPSRVSRALALWIIVSHLTSFVAPVFAGPEGGVVTHGGANISSAGAVTTINQSTDRAVVNWNSFSNAAHETVQFQQPSARSITLNRVTGNSHSQIDGALNANGRVFLLNPNGVVFGKTANVKVNGLLTSTLDMNDDDGFMRGSNTHSLSQNPARAQSAVVNHGRIEAGDGGVALVAPVVNNHGQIVAAVGHVSLAGTTKAVVNYDQQGLVNVAIPTGKGGRGDVTIPVGASSEILEDAAVAPGIVEAGAIVRGADGKITLKNAEGLVINQGSIVARGTGGNGGRVALHGTQATILAKNSLIDASAVGRGKGGDVRVTSGGLALTQKTSKIVARGGDEGGDGGFVDISAPRFAINGQADVRAPKGQTGTLLLDPADIVIADANGGNAACDCLLATNNAIDCCPVAPGCPSIISETVLEGLTGNIVLQACNSITVNDLTTDGTLTLQAGATLTLCAGAGGVVFVNNANTILASGCGALNVNTTGAAVLGNLITACGNITVTAGTSIATANLSAGGTSTIALTAPCSISTGQVCAFNLNLTTAGTASQTGVYTVANVLTLASPVAGQGTFNLGTQANNLAVVNSCGQVCTVRLRDDCGFSVGSLSAAATVELATNGLVCVVTGLSANDLDLTSVSGCTGAFDLRTGMSVSVVRTTNTVVGLCFTNPTAFTVDGISATTSVNLVGVGGFSQTGAITVPNLLLSGVGANVDLGTLNNDVCTVITGTVIDTLSLRDDNGFALNANGGGFTTSLTLTSSGNVNQGGGAFTTPSLVLATNTPGSGSFFLCFNNCFGVVSTANQVNVVGITDLNGFTTGCIQAAGNVRLETNGVVTQASGTISANQISLEAGCAGNGTFNLTAANDANQLRSCNGVNSIFYTDVDGFDVALNCAGATTQITLSAGGCVTQSARIVTPCLTLLGAAGTYNLCSQNNQICTLATCTGTARLRDDGGFSLGATNVTGTLEVRTCGTVNSTGATVGSLVLSSQTCGCGSFNFCGVTLANLSTGSQIAGASITAASAFAVGGFSAATNVSLTGDGAMTGGGFNVTGTLSLTSATAGVLVANFGGVNNNVGTLTTTNNLAALTLRDDSGFNVCAVTATAITLSSNNCVTQSGVITACTLTLTSDAGGAGTFALGGQDNAVGTLQTTGSIANATFRRDAGYQVGNLNAAGNVTLRTNGTVTQVAATTVNAGSLTFFSQCGGTGAFAFGCANNNVTTVASGNQVCAITFRDDNGYQTAFNACGVVCSLNLRSDGCVTQATTINAPVLNLSGAGTFLLNTTDNTVGTLVANVPGTVRLRDDGGFVVQSSTIGTLRAQTDATVRTDCTLSTITSLELQATTAGSGTFDFATCGPVAITNLNAICQVGTVSVNDATGFTVNGNLNVAGNLTITGAGTVDQTGVVLVGGTMSLTDAGGLSVLFDTQNNCFANVTTTNNLTALALRDDNGFTVNNISANAITLRSNGCVNQCTPIVTGTLTLGGSGTFNLNTQNNDVTTLATNGCNPNTIFFRDDTGFDVSGATACAITLQSNGTVTSSGTGVNATALALVATCAGQGTFDMGGVSSDVAGLSWGCVSDVTFRDDNGFAITAGGTISNGLLLDSNGAVTQCVAIAASTVRVRSTAGLCADFQLDTQNNTSVCFGTSGVVGNARYRNDTGFCVFIADVSGTLALTTDGTVGQVNAVNAGNVILTSTSGCTGVFQLACGGTNTISAFSTSNTVCRLAVRTDGAMCVGNTTAVTRVDLVSSAAVTQSGVITTPILTVGGGAGGAFDFSSQNNVIGDVSTAGSVTTLRVRDDAGINVAGACVTGQLQLVTNGCATQTALITAGQLVATGSCNTQGTFTFNGIDNILGAVLTTNSVATIAVLANGGFDVAGITSAGQVRLESTGTVTNSAGVFAPDLVLASAVNGQGSFNLVTADSDVTTVSTANQVASVTFRDCTGFCVAGLSATGAVTLQSNGTVNQTVAINAGTLTVQSDGSNAGTWNLDTQNNEVANFGTGARPCAVLFRDLTGFSVTGANVNGALTLITDGAVTQSGAIAAATLCLTAATAGLGDFNLGTQNNAVTTVSTTTAVNTLAFRDDGGFTLNAAAAFTTSLALSSNGIVNNTTALCTPLLTLSSATAGQGTFNLAAQNQTIGTLATTNLVGTVSVRDDANLTLGTASATALTVRSAGAVNQTGVVTAGTLSLDTGTAGSGDVALNTQANAIGTVLTLNTLNTLAVRSDASLTVGAVTADTSITFQSNGAVGQTGVITTPLLNVAGTAAGQGSFDFSTQNNAFCTVASTTAVNTARLRNDGGFVVGALSASTACLFTCGTVSQTGALSTTTLSLISNTAGAATFDLGTQNNVIGTVNASGTPTAVSVRADAGFNVGTVAATTVQLTSSGTVTESGSITASTLTVRGSAAGSGDFLLTGGNALGCVSTGNLVNSLQVRDDAGFTVSTLTADTAIMLRSDGAVTQTVGGSITTPGLELQGGAGAYNLTTAVDVDRFAAVLNGGSLTLVDVDDLSIGTVVSAGIVTGGGSISLTAAGIAFNESVNLGAGAANIVSTGAVTMAAGKLFTGSTATVNANVGNSIGTAANRFNTNLCALTVPVSGGASLFLNEIDSIAITASLGQTFDAIAGGTLTLTTVAAGASTRAQAGTVALGAINTGTFELVSSSAFVDLNGGDVNITASGNGRVVAQGTASTAGTNADPIEIAGGGTLSLLIQGQVGGVSASFAGTLPNGAGSVILESIPPGAVFFNGFPVGISVAQLVTTALGQGAAGAILSTSGQLTDLVEVAADADDQTQTDESEAEKKKKAAKKPVKQAAKKSAAAGRAD